MFSFRVGSHGVEAEDYVGIREEGKYEERDGQDAMNVESAEIIFRNALNFRGKNVEGLLDLVTSGL